MKLYRAMKEAADGLPIVSPFRGLGIRPGTMRKADVKAINPSDVVVPGAGGMSVVPQDPGHLPIHRKPLSLGGTGRDPVWYIEASDLAPDLRFRQDKPTHGLVEVDQPMTLQEFQDAVARTRIRWVLYCR